MLFSIFVTVAPKTYGTNLNYAMIDRGCGRDPRLDKLLVGCKICFCVGLGQNMSYTFVQVHAQKISQATRTGM